jgi:competence protein ComEA
MENLNQKQKILIGVIVTIMLFVIGYYLVWKTDEGEAVIINNETEVVEKETKPENIIIHITGCVENSGIIKAEKGARIADIIEAAGGLTLDANIERVNLAYKVQDGQKIYIPSINDEILTEIVSSKSGENVIIEDKIEGNSNEIININTATQAELEKLTGIGPSTAMKIIEYREKNGKFTAIEEMKNITGIGDAKFDAMREEICI